MSFFKDFKNDLSMAVNNLPNDNSDNMLSDKPQNEDSIVLDDFGDIGSDEGISVDDLILDAATDEAEEVTESVEASEINLDEISLEDVAKANNVVEEIAPAQTSETEEIVAEKEANSAISAIEETAVAEPEVVAEEPVYEAIENNTREEANTMSEIDEKFENEPATDDNAIVTEGMKITGDIISTGNMDVLGSIKGNIDIKGKLTITGAIEGNSKAAEIFADSAKITGNISSIGSVKVGQSSVIVGDIIATSAVIAGAVKGNIDVHGPVILDTSAIVMGDIKSKSVQINNGAVIEGHCSQCYAEVSPTSFFNDVK